MKHGVADRGVGACGQNEAIRAFARILGGLSAHNRQYALRTREPQRRRPG